MNTGGWILLSLIFGVLLLIVQRAEQKRRLVTLIIIAFVGLIVARYAIYRMANDCIEPTVKLICQSKLSKDLSLTIAYNTLNRALLTAAIFNGLFWVFIGRSNPPGSSDAIKVYGMDD